MRCYVYKSQRRAETYLFLAQRDDFARVPDSVRLPLGDLVFAFDFDLTPGRKLARGDGDAVRANLAANGFHVQFPPPQVHATHDAG